MDADISVVTASGRGYVGDVGGGKGGINGGEHRLDLGRQTVQYTV